MKKVILDSKARFKLERLCDAVYPQECGGALFGPQNSETVWVTDIFPVPNIAEEKNNNYHEHSWGNCWRDLYGKTNNASCLGTFHSHPNGSIPSTQDMSAYNDSNLHLWVVHHGKGEHTFQASIGITHVNFELAAMPVRELSGPELTDFGFRLGEVLIDEHGRLVMDNISSRLMALNEKQRITYLAVLKVKDRWNDFYVKDLVVKLNLSKPTINQRLKALVQAKLVRRAHRDRWVVEL